MESKVKKVAERIIQQVRTKKASFWEKTRAKQVLDLFRLASKKVPAYQDFLKKNKVEPRSINKFANFNSLPSVNKNNYLRKYPLPELSVKGRLDKPIVFTSTSGSTGAPFYFHRSSNLDLRTSIIHEIFYLHGHYKTKEPVLVIVCFGMGVWIGGLITYQAFHSMQERGYDVSIITPGINKKEIFNALKSLGSHYKNIILVGYPPFIKDIIDEAPSNGIEWRKFNVRLIFAAEVFTEDFRDYVCRAVNIKNPCLDTMNIYGTAELGAMAFETPLAILIRRLCAKKHNLFEAIFKNVQKTPTLCQYIPSFISFESDKDDILVSGDNTIPLVRYSLGDHGGTYTFREMATKLKESGINLSKEARRASIERYWYELPFIFIYERADSSTSLYGLQIYPEPIRQALIKKPLSTYLTGKFTLETCFDSKQNQYFLIHLEVRKLHNGTIPEIIKRAVLNAIVEQTELKNSEYRELRRFLGKRALPHLQFWPAEDPKYFKLGIKQKWVKK